MPSIDFSDTDVEAKVRSLEGRVTSLERNIQQAGRSQLDKIQDPISKRAIQDASSEFFAEELLDVLFTDIKMWYMPGWDRYNVGEPWNTLTFGNDNDASFLPNLGKEIVLTTGTDSNASGLFPTKRIFQMPRPSFRSKGKMVTAVSVDSTTKQQLQVITGLSGTASGSNTGFYGFRVDSAVLKGISNDGTTTAEVDLDTAITASTDYRLEAQYEPGKQIVYFVDEEQKGGLSSNLPFADTSTDFYVEMGMSKDATTSAEQRTARVNYIGIAQIV